MQTRALPSLLGLALAAMGCSTNLPNNDFVIADGGGGVVMDGGTTPVCRPGTFYCEGSTRYQCTAQGEIVNRVGCSGDAPMCVPGAGCRACVPGSNRCDPAMPNRTQTCRGDGAGWEAGTTCNADDGSMCVSGVCVDRCSESATGRSYLGCDYWPTQTANSQLDPNFEYAIVLSNPQTYAVRATISGGALATPRTVNLAPGAIETVTLPWVQELVAFLPTFPGCRGGSDLNCRTSRNTARSTFRRNGAYHVHTNGPVAAYQFNPLNFSRTGGYYSFTNDASLLLPQGVMRNRYLVSTWPNWVIRNGTTSLVAGGFVTIVGVVGESTTVTVRPTASVSAGPGVPAIPAGGSQTFSLQPGDALQLISADDRVDAQGRGPDLTGTVIESSLPVAVYVGHDCTNIPESRVACDHLEEQLFPNETWGRDYFVTALRDRGPTNPGVVRIVSQSDDNQLTFDPPEIHPAQTLRTGQVLEFATNRHFRVAGTRAFLVSQFMIGQGPATTGAPGAGDPAMVFEVPVQQYRNQYDFYVPTTYPQNFMNIVTPTGTALTLDNNPLRGTMETVSGFDIYTLPVPSGAHRIRSTSSMPFGIKVYGIAEYTSYMYPGGLDLQLITPAEMAKSDTQAQNLRGSPEAVEKRRAARKLNRMLTEGAAGGVAGDGRTERRRARLLRELEEGTRDPREGLKPIEILQRAHDLLVLGETLTALRKVIRVHPRPPIEPGQARSSLAEIQRAYGFRTEVYEFLGLPEDALRGVSDEPRRRGRPPRVG